MLRRKQRVGHLLSCALAAVALVGCGDGSGDAAAQEEEPTVVAHAVKPPEVATPTAAETAEPLPTSEPQATPAPRKRHRAKPTGILSSADVASFQRLAASLGGAHGLAVSGVGSGQKVERAGALQSPIAWSTAKVPIAMAAIDAGVADSGDLTAAITASDNAAATRLWSALGAPDAAAAAADEELRRGGDQRTQIESQTLRSGYTPFGQTTWRLVDQTRFTAALPCSAAGGQVLGLMGNVIASQRWGLGTVASSALKGGWGPGSTPGAGGGYVDRQMGIVTVKNKPLAVAIASRPANGSHESGTRDLTALTRWLVSHADVRALPAQASC